MSVRREKRIDPVTGTTREFWIVDVDIQLPDGPRQRIRKVSPIQTRRGTEQYERELRQALLDGTFGRKEAGTTEIPTISDFAEEFMRTYVAANNKPSEQATKRIILDLHVLPGLGKLRLNDVEPALEPFKVRLLDKEISRKRVNNVLAVVSKMLRYAEERGLLERAPRVRLLKLRPASHDFFTFEEYAGLLRAARECPDWYAAILCGGDAGLRAGEIIALEWSDIDFHSNNLVIRKSCWEGIIGSPKGGRQRVVPMTQRLRTALRSQRHLRGSFIFCGESGAPWTADAMKRPLWRFCKGAELRLVGWHVLRHTFCSHLAMRGAAPVAIQMLAGHESSETTQRYLHLAPIALRETVRLLDHPDDQKEQSYGNLTATDEKSSLRFGKSTAKTKT